VIDWLATDRVTSRHTPCAVEWSAVVMTVPPMSATCDTAAAAPLMVTNPLPVIVAPAAAIPICLTPKMNSANHACPVRLAVHVIALDAPNAMLLAGVALWPNVGLNVIVPCVAVVVNTPPQRRIQLRPAFTSNAEIGVHSAGTHRFVRAADAVTGVWLAGGNSATSVEVKFCRPIRSPTGTSRPRRG
jgi:hypothetical protein